MHGLACELARAAMSLSGSLQEVDSYSLHMLQELTTDRIVAEADLSKQLGTLRYLLGLRSARQRAEAAQERAVKLEEGQGAGMQQSTERQPSALLSMQSSLPAMYTPVVQCMIWLGEGMLRPLRHVHGLLPSRIAIGRVHRVAMNCLTVIPEVGDASGC